MYEVNYKYFLINLLNTKNEVQSATFTSDDNERRAVVYEKRVNE